MNPAPISPSLDEGQDSRLYAFNSWASCTLMPEYMESIGSELDKKMGFFYFWNGVIEFEGLIKPAMTLDSSTFELMPFSDGSR